MTKRSVSIIIPAFNSADFIGDAVRSCLATLPGPLEVVVVDDGSTDETGAVCAAFGTAIQYLRVENGGVSRARNIGAESASGAWLLFLDSDDVLMPQTLGQLVECAAAQDAGVAYGKVIERGAPGKPDRLNGFDYCAGDPPLPAVRSLRRGVIVTPGSAVVRAGLHRRTGGFVSGYEPMEDRDYWMKCGLLERVAFCDEVVLDKRWRPSSHGSQHAKRIYRGQLAQRRLRTWCESLGADASWIPPDADLIGWALDEAVTLRCPEILPALRRQARAAGVSHWQSLIYASVVRSPEPDWLAANRG